MMSATPDYTPLLQDLPAQSGSAGVVRSPSSPESIRHREDETRWRSIKDYSIFLNDGLLRSFGLVPCPFIRKANLVSNQSYSLDIDFESLKNYTSETPELQEGLLKLCSTSSYQLRQYHAFHYNLFQGMWLWKYQNAQLSFQVANKKSNSLAPSPALSPVLIGSKLSLALLVPLLKSQAAINKDVATETAKLLLELLLELPGMSLSYEFHTPLDQLESVFEEWIENQGETFQDIGISVMVALSCARGSVPSILKTICILQGREDKKIRFHVQNTVNNLINLDIRIGTAVRITGSGHVATWQYDDNLSVQIPDRSGQDPTMINDNIQGTDFVKWHGLATDGVFLYVTGGFGKGIAKLGTGLHGTLQGYTYHHTNNVAIDFIAHGNDILMAINVEGLTFEQSSDFSETLIPFGFVIDQSTLNPKEPIWRRAIDAPRGDWAVVGLTSDGFYFYLIQVQTPKLQETNVEEIRKTPLAVCLSILHVSKVNGKNNYLAVLARPPLFLQNQVDIVPGPETERSRQPRLTFLTAGSQPSPSTSTPTPDTQYADMMTSLGIRVKDLISASFMSSGNYLTVFTEHSTLSPITLPSSLIQSVNRHFGAAGTSNALQSPTAIGTQIHICLEGLIPTYSRTGFGVLPLHSSFQRGPSNIIQRGFTYDAKNNLIWTASGDYMDAWKNPGYIPRWKQWENLNIQRQELLHDDTNVEMHSILNLMWRHVGCLANHVLIGSLRDQNVGFQRENISVIWEILKKMNVRALNVVEVTAFLLVLYSTTSQIKIPVAVSESRILQEIQLLLFTLFKENHFLTKFPSSDVYYAASRLVVQIYKRLCHNPTLREGFTNQLLELIEIKNETLRSRSNDNILKTVFLQNLTEKLERDEILYQNGQQWILAPHILRKLISDDSVQHTVGMFEKYSYEILEKISPPLVCPATAYITAVVNCLLKTWSLSCLLKIPEDLNFKNFALLIFKDVLNHCSTIVGRAIEFSTSQTREHFDKFISTENILKTSLLGLAFPQICMWLRAHSSKLHCCHVHPDAAHNSSVVESLAEEYIQLFVAISHLSSSMVHYEGNGLTDDWSTYMENLLPFQNHRIYESVHPIRENTKLRETILFNGAQRLYVKFDPKCATQYDYDKLTLYAGGGSTAKTVAEYGGNVYGVGNRASAPCHWPRGLVKVEGDIISYTLEIRSGKEQHTSPEAFWGFAFTVFPVYESYTSAGVNINPLQRKQTTKSGVVVREQFFIDKLSLASVDAMSCILWKLINGMPPTILESEMGPFFNNPLLYIVKWPIPNQVGEKDKFLKEIFGMRILELRSIAGAGTLPPMHSKLREMIKPEELEKLYILAVSKCLVDVDTKPEFLSATDMSTNPIALFEMFRSLDSFIRKLVSIASLELRLTEESKEVLKNTMKLGDTFLYDSNSMNYSVVETLALIFDLTFNKNDVASTIEDIRSIIEACITEGSCPQFHKTEQLVEDTFLKLRYILSAKKIELGNSLLWKCKTLEEAKKRISEVHTFVTYHLVNQKATILGILDTMMTQSLRASSTFQGLQFILKLLECSQHNAQSLLMASLLIQHTKVMNNIGCSGLVREIDELAGHGIRAVLEKAKQNPVLHRYSIVVLCIIPYKREDENTLVSSGLLQLLDELCEMQIGKMKVSDSTTLKEDETQDESFSEGAAMKNIASLAWAAFQVLAYRCSSWETDRTDVDGKLDKPNPEHTSLPVQISVNITNHFNRTMVFSQLSNVNEELSDEPTVMLASTSVLPEATQDVLQLLDTLRSTRLGQEIICQSSCIGRLMALLLAPHQPPFIILTIIRLLGTALPLVDTLDISDFQEISIPLVKKKIHSAAPVTAVQDIKPHSIVISLLLSKLADFLVVCGGNQQNLAPTKSEGQAAESGTLTPVGANPIPTPQPVILPHVITVGSGPTATAKAKAILAEQTCRGKNIYMQSHDPARTFLSGEVAALLAESIITLIRQLLAGNNDELLTKKSSPQSLSSVLSSTSGNTVTGSNLQLNVRQTAWTNAVEHTLISSLKPLAKLCGLVNPMAVSLDAYGLPGRIAIAALGVLGSSHKIITIGSQAWIIESDSSMDKADDFDDLGELEFWPTEVKVRNILEKSGIANVNYLKEQNQHHDISPARMLHVPLSRLSVSEHPQTCLLPYLSQSAQRELATYLKNLFLPHAGSSKQVDTSFPMKKMLPTLNQIFSASHGEATSTSSTTTDSESRTIAHRMTVVRLIAEIRSRTAHLLSIWLKSREFLDIFLGLGSENEFVSPDSVMAVTSLKSIAKDCKASHRLQSVEGQVERLRRLYRDCNKPPHVTLPNHGPDEAKTFPTTATCLLNGSSGTTTSDSGFRLRRISDSLQDLNLGPLFPYLADVESDSEISFVMTDDSDGDQESEYASPMSSLSQLLNGALQLENESLNISFRSYSSVATANNENDDESDAVFQDEEAGPSVPRSPGRNATRVIPAIDSATKETKPINTTLRNGCSDSTDQIRVAKQKPENKEYCPATVLGYYLSPSTTYDVRVFTGPHPYICSSSTKLESESEFLSLEDDVESSSNGRTSPSGRRSDASEDSDDIHELLVKAWETKIFPIIRRRFRNESERRDGLEQIRTALTMGMIDIARQTVEGLYEENGGIPRDLHFPTLEEIKADVARFTIERIKIGMHVLVSASKFKSEVQHSFVPESASNSMLKTFDHIGEVLDIDVENELVLVDVYIDSHGILQRFWYPIKCLERLAEQKKPPPNSRNVNMFKLHTNLVSLESSLAQLYCRRAFLDILDVRIMANEADHYLEALGVGDFAIRSEDSFCDFPLNGDLLTRNLSAGAPTLKFLTEMGNPSVLFYKNSDKLKVELRRTIQRAYSRSGEEGLTELTSQICKVMQFGFETFVSDEIPLDKEGSFKVHLPETAFTLISVQGSLPTRSLPVSSIINRDPSVHVYGSNGGDLRLIPLVCYPVQSLGTLLKWSMSAYGSLNPGPGIRDRKITAFPSILVPTDRIICNIAQPALQGHILRVQGVPAKFPLALLYCEELLAFLHEHVNVPSEVGVGLLSILFGFLKKTSIPPLIKEWVFMLCSGVLNAQWNSVQLQEYCISQYAFVNRLFTEVIVLYEQETNLQTHLTLNLNFPFSTNTTTAKNTTRNTGLTRSNNRQNRTRPVLNGQAQGSGRSAPREGPPNEEPTVTKTGNINNTHSFPIVSSYFQALLELCLHLSRGNDLIYLPASLSLSSSAELSPASTPSQMTSNVALNLETEESRSPNHPLQRKRSKPPPTLPKYFGKRNSKLVFPEVKSPGTSSPPIKMVELSVKDTVEMGWFRQAVYALTLLRTFSGDVMAGNKFSIGSEVVQNCLSEMQHSTSQLRLFVIYGAPRNVARPLEISIIRGLNETGGIYANEIWISEDGTDIVVEIRTAAHAEQAFEILKKNLTWYPVEDFLLSPSVSVFCVNNELDTGDRRADSVLSKYLNQKIFHAENPEKLSLKSSDVFSTIFTDCYVSNDTEGKFDESELGETGLLLLKKDHILNNMSEDNLMRKFVEAVKPSNFGLDYFVQEILKKFGQRKGPFSKSSTSVKSRELLHNIAQVKTSSPDFEKQTYSEVVRGAKVSPALDDGLGLSESGFLEWCTQLGKDNLCALWRALFETGHDLRLDKCWVPEKTNVTHLMTQGGWTKSQDAALVTYVNQLVSKLRISPQLLHPHEIYLEENLFLESVFKPLQGIPLEYIRTRFGILQHLNQVIYHNLLPFVSLNSGLSMKTSIASLLHESRYLLFYNTKDEFLYKVFTHSAHRGHEIPPPEVTLDPVKNIGIAVSDSLDTMFSAALCQLCEVPSQMLCVVPATGGDPPLAMVIKFSGEQVQGIIGSFRHFLATVMREIQQPALNLLIPCPSSAAGKNKDSMILRPGPMTYGEERFLQCFGQFIGICLRADVPIPMSLITATWRSLLVTSTELNDIEEDLKEVDILTAIFLETIEEGDENSFKGIVENQNITTFQYTSMDGSLLMPLCPGGRNLSLQHNNKDQFVRLVKKFREKELMSSNRVNMILAGLSTILPLPLFMNLFTSYDLQTRVSGSPEVNLPLLKAHTHYQAGINESDRHIQFFWTALESMTPEELKNFVKFATNQDRLPASCPCQNSLKSTSVHVPPFPMKLAPIEIPHGATEAYINRRTIRAETCLFLIRLPPYTTFEVTRTQLLYASSSRDDPLSR